MKKNTLFSLTALAAVAAGVVLAVCCSPAGRKTGPCDIYAQGGTPCVTAHSTTRLLYSRYKGPLYRVERDSDGASIDIRATKDGYADAAAQDAFLAGTVGRAAEASFNGRWYPRAFRADGTPLGGEEAIDALCQSWAVFCPYADPAHAETALDSALARLVDREHRILRLLDPPYSAENSPGYISGYGPGYRENGGQYTHAAIWLALAALRLGRKSEGIELMRMLLPETHDTGRYEAEPYVLPADVCAAPGREGLAGWTWYTGSAGWYYRALTEELLGLRLEGGHLRASSGALASYRVRWTDGEGAAHEIVKKDGKVYVDGVKQEE